MDLGAVAIVLGFAATVAILMYSVIWVEDNIEKLDTQPRDPGISFAHLTLEE